MDHFKPALRGSAGPHELSPSMGTGPEPQRGEMGTDGERDGGEGESWRGRQGWRRRKGRRGREGERDGERGKDGEREVCVEVQIWGRRVPGLRPPRHSPKSSPAWSRLPAGSVHGSLMKSTRPICFSSPVPRSPSGPRYLRAALEAGGRLGPWEGAHGVLQLCTRGGPGNHF